MLDTLDEIDWSALEGAYGPATETPDILRAIASPDPETAGEGQYEFASSIWHQGTVYPVTVRVVPFLVELATTPGVHQRHHLLHTLGALCDERQSYGADQPAVRAAVADQLDALVPSLTDPDPQVRECAAYAVAHATPRSALALLAHWDTETDPRVRASLLLALALVDPVGSADRLRSAASTDHPLVRAAAAIGLARAGLPFPPRSIAAIATAATEAQVNDSPWHTDEWLPEVLKRVDDATTAALVAALTDTDPATPGDAGARARAAQAMESRFRASRSAPAELMPRLRHLLTDADPSVRAAAVSAAADAGLAAAAVSDELAHLALTGDEPAAKTALATLVRLGDPRWRDPVLAAWAAGDDPYELRLCGDYPVPFDPDLLEGARRRLLAQLADGLEGGPVIHVVVLLGSWGAAAAPAVNEILAALRAAPWVVPSTLAAIGAAALPAVPALGEAAYAGEVRAGHAVWRLTGDPAPLVAAAERLLARKRHSLAWELDLVADAGPAAAPLVATLRERLTGRATKTYPEREDQIAAARVVWRATGDADGVLPTVEAILRAGDVPVRAAARLAADMTPAAGAGLAKALRKALRNEWGSIDAARALWQLGTPPADLVAPLLKAVADPYGDKGATALLVRMGAVTAVPGLADLAERDERVVVAGASEDLVWLDDRLRCDLRDAVAQLS